MRITRKADSVWRVIAYIERKLRRGLIFSSVSVVNGSILWVFGYEFRFGKKVIYLNVERIEIRVQLIIHYRLPLRVQSRCCVVFISIRRMSSKHLLIFRRAESKGIKNVDIMIPMKVGSMKANAEGGVLVLSCFTVLPVNYGRSIVVFKILSS